MSDTANLVDDVKDAIKKVKNAPSMGAKGAALHELAELVNAFTGYEVEMCEHHDNFFKCIHYEVLYGKMLKALETEGYYTIEPMVRGKKVKL